MADERTYRNGILVEPSEGYNGWTNYPTWAVKLWIDNEEGSYTYWRELTAEILAHIAMRKTTQSGSLMLPEHFDAAHELADRLKDEHHDDTENYLTNPHASVYDDRWATPSGCVNWHEIAEALISEASE